jgi:hypothetical protein
MSGPDLQSGRLRGGQLPVVAAPDHSHPYPPPGWSCTAELTNQFWTFISQVKEISAAVARIEEKLRRPSNSPSPRQSQPPALTEYKLALKTDQILPQL